jgi:hypothetical protein
MSLSNSSMFCAPGVHTHTHTHTHNHIHIHTREQQARTDTSTNRQKTPPYAHRHRYYRTHQAVPSERRSRRKTRQNLTGVRVSVARCEINIMHARTPHTGTDTTTLAHHLKHTRTHTPHASRARTRRSSSRRGRRFLLIRRDNRVTLQQQHAVVSTSVHTWPVASRAPEGGWRASTPAGRKPERAPPPPSRRPLR